MTKQKRILIVRPDRIGDVVLATPLPRELKRRFEGSFIAVLVRKYTKEIFLNNPYVDEILVIDDLPEKGFSSFIKKVKVIRSFNFTHSLTLLPTERINYILFFAGIKTRIGVGHKFYQFITFTKSVHRHKYIPLRHEADYCMDLARKMGIRTNNLETEIHLSNDEKVRIDEKRFEWLKGEKYIVGVHSTSGNSSPNWPPVQYRDLIFNLLQAPDFRIIVTDNIIPGALKNIEGIIYPNENVSLREAILNIASLDYLISASTGPMHIAAALKVKTISMFCPLTACSPKLWGPKGNSAKILLPEDGYCENLCPGDPKICTFEGEGGITNDQIVSVLLNSLRAS